MNITTHVNRLISSSFYQLRRIKTIRRSLPTTTAITLINSFVISRIDYCNSLLCGLPSYQLARLQSVLNAAAARIGATEFAGQKNAGLENDGQTTKV